MTLPATGQISMSDIRTELSMSGMVSMSEFDTKINQCSPFKPDGLPPYSMSEWYSYNHNAVPAAPNFTVYMTGSGIDPADHDTKLSITPSYPTCATKVDITFSATVGGTYTTLQSNFSGSNYVHTGRSPDTSYYYKMVAKDDDGRTSAEFGPVQGRTGPTVPQNFQAFFGTGTSNNYTVTLTWNNGTSPGERDMDPFVFRRRINFGSFTAWATASVGGTPTQYSDTIIGAGLTNFDQITYQLAYEPEDETVDNSQATHFVSI